MSNIKPTGTLHGSHRLFMGDNITIYTRKGFVYVKTDITSGHDAATLTREQALEIAQDLVNYADLAATESSAVATA